MDLQQWREQAVGEVDLPSGLTVRYNTRFSVLDLAAQGQIPQALVGMVEANAGRPNQFEMLSHMSEFIEAANALIRATWLFPKVTDAPSPDSIGIDEIPVKDKVFYFDHIGEGSGLKAAVPFPVEQNTNGNALPAGQDVSNSTLVNPGDLAE